MNTYYVNLNMYIQADSWDEARDAARDVFHAGVYGSEELHQEVEIQFHSVNVEEL